MYNISSFTESRWLQLLPKYLIAYKAIVNKVITKLPNSEQSFKGKVETHQHSKSVNNRKTVKTVMTLSWYRHF
jgi:hypothetical protein